MRFYTVIITDDNSAVIIPNSKLSNEVIVNLSKEGRRRVDIDLKFNYSHDLSDFDPIIRKAMIDSKVVMEEPFPKIEIINMEHDGFHVRMNGWVNAEDYETSKSRLQQAIINQLKSSDLKWPGMA